MNNTTKVFGKATHKGQQLIGRKCKIISDNENYDKWRDKTLVITYASNTGCAYDNAAYPEMLCDFELEDGGQFPCALYEYEFELID
jgi:hypothetical protein